MTMLHAAFVTPGAELSGSAAVVELQKALAGLAQVSGKAGINPGTTSGVVDDRTIGAVGAAAALLKAHVPDQVPGAVWTILENAEKVLKGAQAVCGVTAFLSPQDAQQCQEMVKQARQAAISGITSSASVLTKAITALRLLWPKIASPSTPTVPIDIHKRYARGAGINLTPSPSVAPPATYAKVYPKGSIAAYDPAIAKYRVAMPVSAASKVLVDQFGLGQATGEKYLEMWTEASKANLEQQGIVILPLKEYERLKYRKWYKRWTTWALVGGGVVTVGVGYLWWRRRRKG